MDAPRRFLLLVLLTAAVSWCIGTFVHVRCPTPDLKWARLGLAKSHRDLAERTARTVPVQRVLLAGGSGTFFGVSAKDFASRTSVFAHNVAAHAGLGTVGVSASVVKIARAHDWVLFAPEYPMLGSSDGLGGLTVPFLATHASLGAFASGPEEGVRRLLLLGSPGIPTFLSGVGERVGFGRKRPEQERDGYGDLLSFPARAKSLPSVKPLRPTGAAHTVLRSLRSELEARGARLLLVLPFAHVAPEDAATARATAKGVLAELARIAPVLTTDDRLELSADEGEFSNTPYHASPVGRTQRTRRLADAFVHFVEPRPPVEQAD